MPSDMIAVWNSWYMKDWAFCVLVDVFYLHIEITISIYFDEFQEKDDISSSVVFSNWAARAKTKQTSGTNGQKIWFFVVNCPLNYI